MELGEIQLASIVGIAQMPNLHELVLLQPTLAKDFPCDVGIDEPCSFGIPRSKDLVVAAFFFFRKSPGDAGFRRALLLLREGLDGALEV